MVTLTNNSLQSRWSFIWKRWMRWPDYRKHVSCTKEVQTLLFRNVTNPVGDCVEDSVNSAIMLTLRNIKIW